MLSLFRLVLKYLELLWKEVALGADSTKPNHSFQLVHQFSGILTRQTWSPILFQQVPQVAIFGTIPPCSEGCCREGVASRCFHTFPHQVSRLMLSSNAAFWSQSPVGFWAKWLLVLLMATWPLSPPMGLHTAIPVLWCKKVPLTASQANLQAL